MNSIYCRVRNADLWALALRESNPSVLELFNDPKSIKEIVQATPEELMGIKGIGEVKAAQIKAIIELAQRMMLPNSEEQVSIRRPLDVSNLIMPMLRYEDREHFLALLVNTKNQIIRIETISIGTLNSSLVHPRELFKPAIKYSAAAVIICHNHPSGSPEPSKEDLELTCRLQAAGELIGIGILDHVIIGDGSFISMKERGYM